MDLELLLMSIKKVTINFGGKLHKLKLMDMVPKKMLCKKKINF